MYFAVVEIPTTVVGLMALIITTLCGVIVWQQNRLDKHSIKNDNLQELRLQDFRDIISKNTEVMRDDAQANRILAEKIDGAKSKL